MQKIDFYFDFLSPFSYFAWKNHQNKLPKDRLEINYKPVLMGKLFSHFEFRGPGEIEVKRNYELKKCFRYAAKNKITFLPPKEFPFNPIALNRCATLYAAKSEQFKIIDFLFDCVWAHGMILDDPDLIAKILLENKFSPEVIDLSFERAAKQELKANIASAIHKNIFGVPTFAVDDEYFWGNDSFDDLNDYLSKNDNWNKELYNQLVEK